MTFMRKILDAFKLESTREIENNSNETESNKKYNDYYKNIAKQKENNIHISYDDVKYFDLKPFDLNKSFISDGNFTAIELEGENLDKAYRYLQVVHDTLMPFRRLFENAVFPSKIGTNYMFGDSDGHLPVSHLRLIPYTATMKESKYPLHLWLSYLGNNGTEYLYSIYFDKNGEIGKCDLSLHGSNGARLSYESKIRRNKSGLYVMRIDKTLYIEPYGTKTLYHCKDGGNFSEKYSKTKYMSEYDIERYAIECNAYVVHEERNEQQERSK